MKRILPLILAALLITVSCPVLSYAEGEGAISSLLNSGILDNYLSKDTGSPDSETEIPAFEIGDVISQFMTQGDKNESVAAEEVPVPEDAAAEAAAEEDAVAAEEAATEEVAAEEGAAEEAAAEEAAVEEVAAAEAAAEEAAAEEAAAEKAAAAEEAARAEALAEKAAEVLGYLDNEAYANTMASLQEGNVINYGDYSYDASGLQQLLVDLGWPISVDGSAGPATFNALNTILANLGTEEASAVDGEIYWQLLALQLMNTDAETADEILPKYYDEEEENGSRYYYIKATLLFTQEKYYHAMEAYQESQYGDWEEKAALCPQAWPSGGEMWHNTNYYSSQMSLSFKVNSYDEDLGRCFEVYTADNVLVSVLFLTGSGTVTTWLPGGVYKIKNASGSEWYGFADAFGRYGDYEFMEFDEDESNIYLTWLDAGYEWTITINVQEADPDTANVGSVYTDWEDWTE